MKLNITLPCYNEERILKSNILRVFNFLKENITSDDWQIIIANNQSTDKTGQIGKELEKEFESIKYLEVFQKGKGIAIRESWQRFPADIYIFMDADLATNLEALLRLIRAVKEEKFNVAMGSRFHPQSKVKRKLIRKIISFGYNLLRKILIGSKITDAPCGFKAVDKKIIQNILPQVKDEQWFFDSELVILAEKEDYKIKEIPIKWEDIREKEDKSKVNTISLSLDYFKKLIKLKKRLKK